MVIKIECRVNKKEDLIKLLKDNIISTGTLMRSTKTTLYNSFITSHEGQDQYQLMFNYLILLFSQIS